MPSRKILIVEDHPAIRNMLASLFKNAGYQVTEASDGALGLAAATEGNFAAIMLDLKMPQMDGLEVMKNLKLNPPKLPNGPIIVFSSAAYDYAKQDALAHGATEFILKDDLEAIHLVEHVENVMLKYNQDLETKANHA
jgi:CheY-like chemotaxis protein